jgi:hypothetical protein
VQSILINTVVAVNLGHEHRSNTAQTGRAYPATGGL